ncbi:MAG: hypothetical protein II696_02935 [Firmicutes bacterium]|nr:hypothetical protein [Bacillota bacterium]
MNLTELLELIEIDEPADFEYVESFAEIVENDDEIPEEVLCELFRETDPETVSELIDSYFTEIEEILEDGDICELLETIKYSLMALIEDGDEQSIYRFGEELARFQIWYSFESQVIARELGEDQERVLCLRDAVTQKRMEKFEGEGYDYDFSECLDYEIEEFILDMAGVSRERRMTDGSDDLMDNGYVYDEGNDI